MPEFHLATIDQKRVRSIFLTAVEDHAPEGWDEYLGVACRGEPELRQRVEFLLRGHNQPNDLLDDPGAAPVAPSMPAIGEGPGTLVGPYKLLEQIGEGGFGVVFMAEQLQPVRRKVALKIVKPGMDTRQVVARFEAERQALALMDHPNIARIFDGGATESGRPYFVMELVRGVPITEFCEEHHLGIRERLELFTHVCQAVQHAHQKGIIHRDLKPSNVMVTLHGDKPVVKIIDFGIAKATRHPLTDKTLFTNFAQMIGTPMYMSPEQAQMSGLDVDTRSDVYSLGVLLYELMTGKTPFEKDRLRSAPYAEMIRIICEEEPVRPSTRISTLGDAAKTVSIDPGSTPQKLSQLLRGELDWIVMKALEKDRNRRYESAGALAEEVQRYLHDEPVLACPPSVAYRLRKSARRHRTALATAAIVFTALSAGTTVAIWQAVVATRAAAAEKTAKIAAEAKEAEAEAVISFLENRVFSAARPEGQGGGLGQAISLRDAIDAAAPFVQEGFKDQPLIEARLRQTLGQSFQYLEDWKKSIEQFEAARAIYTKRLGPDDQATLSSMSGLATSYSSAGRFEEGRQLHEQTLARQKALLGPDHFDTLRSMNNLSNTYDELGRQADALALREERLARCEAKYGRNDEETLRSIGSLSNSYSNMGRDAEALKLREELLAGRKAMLGPDHPDTLIAMHNLANTYGALRRHREAFKMHEDVLSRRKVKLGPEHPMTLSSMASLADCYASLRRYKEAIKLSEETVALMKVRLGADHSKTLRAMNGLVLRYYDVGRDNDAISLGEETLRLQKAKLGPDHPETLDSMHNLALGYGKTERNKEALSIDEETLARRQARLGIDHPSTLKSMNSVAVQYRKLGRSGEALPLLERTVALRTARLGAGHRETLTAQSNLAWCLADLNRSAEAVPIIDDCIQRALKVEMRRGFVNDLVGLRMAHFRKLKDVAGCRATVAMWDAMGRTDADDLYDAGCFHALVAAVIREQDPSPEAETQSNAEADVAMDRLRKAVTAGYKNRAHMSKDADLDLLRKRPDFIKLMAEIPEPRTK